MTVKTLQDLNSTKSIDTAVVYANNQNLDPQVFMANISKKLLKETNIRYDNDSHSYEFEQKTNSKATEAKVTTPAGKPVTSTTPLPTASLDEHKSAQSELMGKLGALSSDTSAIAFAKNISSEDKKLLFV